MSYQHQLFLEIPTVANPRIMKVIDASIYTSLIQVTNEKLEVTPPGFSVPTIISTGGENFNLTLNACLLGMQMHNCGTSSDPLPDGIYNIRYSVNPNSTVFVEYDHMRVTQILNRYYQKLCNLEMAACEPDADVKEQLKKLRLVKSFIDAAKANVEDCHDNDTGMSLLRYAEKLLTKLDGKKCSDSKCC